MQDECKLISIGVFIGIIATICLSALLGIYDEDIDTQYIPVIEHKIDTIYKVRDSIITEVKYIETIKHDTIEKIYNLNDSSTVELFYKLVTE